MDSYDQTTRFRYNPTEIGTQFSGILEIFVHHARNIHNICIYENQDVYAKFSLTYNPDETFSTRVINGGGKNPEFNEKLVININQFDAVLKCEMWMMSRAKNFMEDQLLGFSLVPVSLILENGKLTQDFSLSSTDLFHSPAGTVKLSFSLNTNLPFKFKYTIGSGSGSGSVSVSSITSEVVLLDPVEYSRIEFPDINVVKENQQMVSEYFGLSGCCSGGRPMPGLVGSGSDAGHGSFLCLGASGSNYVVDDYDMVTKSGSISPNESIQNSGLFSSTMTSLSDDRNSADSLDKKNNSLVGKSLVSANVESSCSTLNEKNEVKEESEMQQQIIDMYMRSMQQFTESLAKMKLPMNLETVKRWCFIKGLKKDIILAVVATSRSSRLPSDSGAFADWVANPSSSSALRVSDQDLSLGFNACGGGSATATAGMWSSSTAPARQINYGFPEMGMLGVRDVFVVADHHAYQPHLNTSVAGAPATALGVGVGVIPLLTPTPCPEDNMVSNRGSGGGGRASNTNTGNSNYSIQFWQQHPQQPPHNYLSKSMIPDHGFLQASVGGGGSTSTSGSTMTCQDCGNQAKKDCSHRRCRTCCKSRGFDCATHVKSTWVPAARRRERQLMTTTGAASVSSASTSGPKKPRLTSQATTTSHTSTSNTTPPRSFDTSSSHHKQDASFKESLPGQVRAPAVFKCVKVTAVEDGDDEYAYQASATIGGHVFKGFLYDQGVEPRDQQSSFPNFSKLHLGGSGSGTGVGRNVSGSSSSPSPLLDASDVFGSSGGGLLTGSSTYGNPIN